ncbi:DUF1810 domain-containing protein [Flavitalea sp.]|nr:DUF1810 domain-containing protein [Flavitalea sp.]
MSKDKDLTRFEIAQKTDYEVALDEIKKGRKTSHWMWYIFPQIEGLGLTDTSRFYSIKDVHEAVDYLKHPVLGKRLVAISGELLKLKSNNARMIFGIPDDMKLRSSMSLFASIPATDPVFQLVLDKFFDGQTDPQTMRILGLDQR